MVGIVRRVGGLNQPQTHTGPTQAGSLLTRLACRTKSTRIERS